jgi:hypothetical protein
VRLVRPVGLIAERTGTGGVTSDATLAPLPSFGRSLSGAWPTRRARKKCALSRLPASGSVEQGPVLGHAHLAASGLGHHFW